MHRRLKRRLAGDSSWIEFSGPASARKILNGLDNIDEYQINLPGDRIRHRRFGSSRRADERHNVPINEFAIIASKKDGDNSGRP
jgi:hypothetical protein